MLTLSPEFASGVLDAAPDAMLVIDGEGAIVFANQQVEKLFGYAPSEISGQPVEMLIPPEFRGRHVTHRWQYARHQRRRPMGSGIDLFALRKDGSQFACEISLSPITDGCNALVAAAIRDVTGRRQVQEELRQARTAADRANLAKSRFLATAAHDLRQPLQAQSLLTGGLRHMVTDADAVAALQMLDRSIAVMSRLLNALLDISKLESGAIRPEITDFTVASLFEEMRSEFAGLAESKGLQLSVEPSNDGIRSDPSLLGQVLRNLVSNAIKYTRQGCVQLRCLRDLACVRIEVLDTGIGIQPDQLDHIYDEFYQIGIPQNAARDGYGLGLSIVQRVVRLLDLRLDVTSEVGKGSKFSVTVPASEERMPRAAIGPADGLAQQAALARRPHALLVEDDAAVRGATRMLLTVEGYEVTESASLTEAVAQAQAHQDIALLITDYHLGGEGTGMDVIAAVRGALTPDIRAVLMTGDTSAAVKDLRHDVNTRIVSKPINASELLALLAELQA